MIKKLSAASVAVQGSGWGWLGFNKQFDRLEVVACPNQDPLQATTGKSFVIRLTVSFFSFFL
jgi:Fe-Mn family superoxide dismutase